jgi:hypothetical protein
MGTKIGELYFNIRIAGKIAKKQVKKVMSKKSAKRHFWLLLIHCFSFCIQLCFGDNFSVFQTVLCSA